MHAGSTVTFLFDLNPVPLDLLIKRRKRNVETVGRLGLTPPAALEHLDNNSLLDRVDDVEKRTLLRE